MHHVVVHNVGHHDLYLADRPRPPIALERPSAGRFAELGAALNELALEASELAFGGDGVLLERPWRDGEKAFEALLMPLQSAVLRSLAQQCQADRDCQSATLFLVTAGREGARKSPRSLATTLMRHAQAWWSVYGAGVSLKVQHLDVVTDPYDVDPASLFLGVQVRLEAIASELGPDWRERLQVYLSVSTGTNSMVAGLYAQLARWRPLQLLIPNARRMPDRRRGGELAQMNARMSELRDFGRSIPMNPDDLPEAARLAHDAMIAWLEEYRAQRPTAASELTDSDESLFWFRKGKKEVLATVVVRQEGELVVRRGVNVEVSLPTGTLCAERNAIGTAFAAYPRLTRGDILAVAVLSRGGALPRLGPCGACQEWLRKVAEVNPGLCILGYDDEDMDPCYVQALPG